MSGAIQSVRLNYRVPDIEAAKPVAEQPSADRETVAQLPTIEGIDLAREQSQGFTALGMLLVYTAAITIIAFIAGQAFQHFVTDARAYELERRV